jgi:pyridinium-3,5-bisthiocarboxylic acid mononucleotide nickel chelatase
MTHLHLEPIGGVAGDMFIAAMLDAFPHFTDGLLGAIGSVGLPPTVSCSLVEHHDHGLVGHRFRVQEVPARHRSIVAAQTSAHRHVSLREICERLDRSSLPEGVSRRAKDIFWLLAEAEAAVHRVDVLDVSFHEVGAWDSIADIVGAAYLVEALGGASWSIDSLPLGRGRVRCEHGQLPVPAPATARLLQGLVVHNDGIEGERVTPTGAAIVRYLKCASEHDGLHRRLVGSGVGFGTRRLPGISNVLRVLVFDDATAVRRDQVTVVAFEVDDQSNEDLAAALQRLREYEGVLDVMQISGYGKKGRNVVHVQILVRPEHAEALVERCFEETTTIGIRYQATPRIALDRKAATVTVAGQPLGVKIVRRPDGSRSAKAEMDDIARLGRNRADRDALRRAAEALALEQDQEHD